MGWKRLTLADSDYNPFSAKQTGLIYNITSGT